jgi:hypothetical protein
MQSLGERHQKHRGIIWDAKLPKNYEPCLTLAGQCGVVIHPFRQRGQREEEGSESKFWINWMHRFSNPESRIFRDSRINVLERQITLKCQTVFGKVLRFEKIFSRMAMNPIRISRMWGVAQAQNTKSQSYYPLNVFWIYFIVFRSDSPEDGHDIIGLLVFSILVFNVLQQYFWSSTVQWREETIDCPTFWDRIDELSIARSWWWFIDKLSNKYTIMMKTFSTDLTSSFHPGWWTDGKSMVRDSHDWTGNWPSDQGEEIQNRSHMNWPAKSETELSAGFLSECNLVLRTIFLLKCLQKYLCADRGHFLEIQTALNDSQLG